MNDSFIFYRSFYEAIEDFQPEEFKEAMMALMKYAFDGEESEVSGYVKTFYKLVKPQIDANNGRRANGQKGGAPAGNQNAKKQPKNNLETTKQPTVDFENNSKQPNVNDNDNVNVNDNLNANDNDNANVNVNVNANANDNTFCPEAETAPAGIAASFQLNDGTLYNVTENDVVMYQQLYPGIDCRQELRNIVGWCDANPSRRKTRSGAKRFLNNWLSRAQNQAKPSAGTKKSGSAYIDAIHNRMDVVDEWYRKRQEANNDG